MVQFTNTPLLATKDARDMLEISGTAEYQTLFKTVLENICGQLPEITVKQSQ